MQLQKVSTHVGLRNPRRLKWIGTVCEILACHRSNIPPYPVDCLIKFILWIDNYLIP